MLPLLLSAGAVMLLTRSKREKTALALCAVVSLYLALGPSLKYESMREAGESASNMRPERALFPTGASILYSNVPGLNNMRATYRWVALASFSLWALTTLGLAQSNRPITKRVTAVLLGVVAMFNLPHMGNQTASAMGARKSFLELDRDFVDPLRASTVPGEKLGFLPASNDVLANYAVPRAQVKSFNIGGDKNWIRAREAWPDTLRGIHHGIGSRQFSYRVIALLLDGDVDAIVLPYVDMLWAAHKWPYPTSMKEAQEGVERRLIASDIVDVDRSDFFSVIRLKPGFRDSVSRAKARLRLAERLCLPPSCVGSDDFGETAFTRVGQVDRGMLVTTGRAGVLHFGPYAAIEAGTYEVVLKGTFEDLSGAFVDIVSNQGRHVHGKYELQSHAVRPMFIKVAGVEINEAVTDIEVRVFVSAASSIALESVRLIRH